MTVTDLAVARVPARVTGVADKLSLLDRFLLVWTVAAMAVGLLAGRRIPEPAGALNSVAIEGTSVSIRAGLLIMIIRCRPRPAMTGGCSCRRWC